MVPAQGNQQRSYDNKSNANRARVNHVNAEQAEEATDVVIGNLLVNSVFAKVLFNNWSIAFFCFALLCTSN